MEGIKLYMILLGSTPQGRFTEQHDIFFGIGKSLSDLVPDMIASWPEANGKIHIDSWREVTVVEDFKVHIVQKAQMDTEDRKPGADKIFFLNLGGYKPGDLEEYHYKILVVAPDKSQAIQKAKASAFYIHTGFKGAESHIDDKYGVDVDDIYEIEDILSESVKTKFEIKLEKSENLIPDEPHVGYVAISKLMAGKS
ncbi:MAG: DUF1543 domain-containing protein [Bacteroidetes bacterium]|nr:MAG: DUF1543 domain-containing protein [Bacteroidota bacterium]